MRKIIVANIVSLDGYYEGPHNGVMDLPMDDAFNTNNLERFEAADTVLLGATSYQGFSSYWPSVPTTRRCRPTTRGPGRTTRPTAPSAAVDEVAVVVVSDSHGVDRRPVGRNTRVIGRDEVAALKESGDGECVVFGSRTMWNGLLADGLVDELHLMVGATVLGGGTRLFDAPVSLTLRHTRRFDGSDNVLLVYVPK